MFGRRTLFRMVAALPLATAAPSPVTPAEELKLFPAEDPPKFIMSGWIASAEEFPEASPADTSIVPRRP